MWNFLLTIYLWLQSEHLEKMEFNTWAVLSEFAPAGMNNDACERNHSAQTWLHEHAVYT